MSLHHRDNGRGAGYVCHHVSTKVARELADRPHHRATVRLNAASSGRRRVLAATTRTSWHSRQLRRIGITDAVMVAITLLGTYFALFGVGEGTLDWPVAAVPYAAIMPAIGIVWFLALLSSASRERWIAAGGISEYAQVFSVSFTVFGGLAITCFLIQAHLSRLLFLIAFPVGTALVMAGRAWCQHVLMRHRLEGREMDRAILIGSGSGARRALAEIRGRVTAGIEIVGVCPLDTETDPVAVELPRVTLEELQNLSGTDAIDAVVVSPGLPADRVRALAWALEQTNVSFLMAPSLMGVTGSRIHAHPLPGLTLMHIDLPRISPLQQFAKRLLDIAFSAVALILLAPVLLMVAIAIKTDSPGPAIFAQRRIGRNGKPFTIHKFRTMGVDAEDQLDALIAAEGGSALRFKLRDDPRVTRVGAFLRRTSIDELPQFWDVLRGPMSVVGPRPQAPREVAEYSSVHSRRLLVKPGITGLWQVSGRSNLSEEHSTQLDLFYVENWSIAEDIVIMLKTVRVLVTREGAF